MDLKRKLAEVLKEHHKLKEELKMRKLKEQNVANQDTQADPKSANTPLPSQGGDMKQDAPQNDQEIQEANQAEQDISADVPAPVAPSDGTPMKPDAPQNDEEIQQEAVDEEEGEDEEKKEQLEDEEEEQKEQIEEPEVPEEEEPEMSPEEKFREMEDDMTKLVDVVEALKNQVDDMGKKISDMEERFTNQAGPEEEEEPLEPVSESMILNSALKESVGKVQKEESLGKAMSRFIRA